MKRRIRDAVFPDDLAVVRHLFQEYADWLDFDLCFQGFGEEMAGLPGRYAPPAGGLWLAEIGGEVAGCIALRAFSPEVAEMKRLFVRPAFQGRGLGRALAEHLLSAAAQKGYRRICLDTLPAMREAISLYRRLGFREVAPYYHNPIEGALFFERELP